VIAEPADDVSRVFAEGTGPTPSGNDGGGAEEPAASGGTWMPDGTRLTFGESG
jgi:hypothetical protein